MYSRASVRSQYVLISEHCKGLVRRLLKSWHSPISLGRLLSVITRRRLEFSGPADSGKMPLPTCPLASG